MVVRRKLSFVSLLLVLLGASALPALAQLPSGSESPTPSESDTDEECEEQYVEVRDDGYLPAEVAIAPGDCITWVWFGDQPHSATAVPDETNEREFDSHPDCGELLGGCGTEGEVFTHEFLDPGTFRYGSRAEGDEESHAGVVTVTAPEPSPSSPDPTETDGSEPTPTPTPTPTSPSPEPEPSPDPTTPPSPTPEPTPEPTTTSPSPAPGPTNGAPPRFTSRPVGPTPTAEAPIVAGDAFETPSPTTTPTFESFPEPQDPEDLLTEEDTEPDEVVVAAPTGGGSDARLVWGLIGGGMLAATLGAFGRLVLFSELWA